MPSGRPDLARAMDRCHLAVVPCLPHRAPCSQPPTTIPLPAKHASLWAPRCGGEHPSGGDRRIFRVCRQGLRLTRRPCLGPHRESTLQTLMFAMTRSRDFQMIQHARHQEDMPPQVWQGGGCGSVEGLLCSSHTADLGNSDRAGLHQANLPLGAGPFVDARPKGGAVQTQGHSVHNSIFLATEQAVAPSETVPSPLALWSPPSFIP